MQRLFWLGLGVAVGCGGATAKSDADQGSTGGLHQGAAATASGGVMGTGGRVVGQGGRGGSGNATGGANSVAAGRDSLAGGSAGDPAGQGGAAGGGAPGSGPGGVAGHGGTKNPISVCGSNTLAGGIYCSKADFCETLGCGKPWSLFDAEGCSRKVCGTDDACPNGKRCVPAPVAGKFDQSCFAEYDSCADSSGTCECFPYLECGERGVCLSEQEFPPESECPAEGLSCATLRSAATNLQKYADGEDFFLTPGAGGAAATVNDRVEACRTKVDGLLASCN